MNLSSRTRCFNEDGAALVSLLALFSASQFLYFHMKMVHYLQNPHQMTKFTDTRNLSLARG